MSQFAAGCAICGADLVAARAASGGATIGDRLARLEPEFLRSTDARREIALVLVMILIVLGMPIFGLVLCAWIGFQRHQVGDGATRNIALALAVFAILEMAVFELQYGLLWDLLG